MLHTGRAPNLSCLSAFHLEAERSGSQSRRFYSIPSHSDTRPHDLGPDLQWVGKSLLEKNEPPAEQPSTCESMTRKNTSWEVRVLSVKGAETTGSPQRCQHDPLLETPGSTVCVPSAHSMSITGHSVDHLYPVGVCVHGLVLHEKKLEGN